MVALIGSSATIDCEPGQARKGAATAIDSGAGVQLVGAITIFGQSICLLLTCPLFNTISSPLL